MSRTLTEEERLFIADCFNVQKFTGKKIIQEFNEKFEWTPSASVINKYQNYKGKPEEPDETPKEEKAEDIEIETDDTRKVKDVFDFSDGDIPDDVFDKIVKLTGKSKAQTWELLKKCHDKGLTKINLKTGDVSK